MARKKKKYTKEVVSLLVKVPSFKKDLEAKAKQIGIIDYTNQQYETTEATAAQDKIVNKLLEKQTKLIVGLDISTKTIGIGFVVIEGNKLKNIDCTYYKPNDKHMLIHELILQSKNDVIEMIEDYMKSNDLKDITPIICVEDIIVYMRNTTPTTLTKLASINRAISVGMLEKFGNINVYSVMTIRTALKKSCNMKEIEKEQVPSFLDKLFKHNKQDYSFDYEINRNDNIKTETYDKADGLAVATCFLLKNKMINTFEPQKPIKTTKKAAKEVITAEPAPAPAPASTASSSLSSILAKKIAAKEAKICNSKNAKV